MWIVTINFFFVGLNFRAIYYKMAETSAETMSYSYESAVQGHHIYKEIWEASCGQMFPCLREDGNSYDPFAVAVMRADTIIGHVPKTISAACSLLLRNHGSIQCIVTGS